MSRGTLQECVFDSLYFIRITLQAQDVWQDLAKLKDPRLQQLAQQLFGFVMSSKAPSTEKKYLYACMPLVVGRGGQRT